MLLEMGTGADAMEISIKVPQKSKNGSSYATPGCMPEGLWSPHAPEMLRQCSTQLFTTALRRKPEEQMWKMCMYTREFYLAVKIITSAGKWMGPEVILLSNYQIQKEGQHMFSLICGP